MNIKLATLSECKESSTAYLEASLSSYSFYLKLGYKPIEYHQYDVENGRVMLLRYGERIREAV